MAKKRGMSMAAVAGVLKSKKTPPHLKEGLKKKYASQLKKEGYKV